MVDRYEPYEPPSEHTDGESERMVEPESRTPQWPLLGDRRREEPTASASGPSSGPSPMLLRRPQPSRSGAYPGVAVAAVAAVIAIGIASYSAAQPDEPDYRDQWQECLAEEQGNGGLLEPEDLCSITYPDGEEDYGDLGYDNPEDEYDWYLEDESP